MAENFDDIDVAIIGGGPAGLAAAFWCAELGIKAVLFEKEPEFGGQLLWTFNAIENYLGIDTISGPALRDRFLAMVERRDVLLVNSTEVTDVDLTEKRLSLADGRQFSAKTIIIATGVRRRQLGVPGEEEFRGRGILRSGIESKDKVAGKTVLIVGGGDAALENAFILSKSARKVIVVHRRGEFSARREFVDALCRLKNIEIIFDCRIISIFGKERVEGIYLNNILTGTNCPIGVDAVLIRLGVEPNTSLFSGQIELDTDGFLIVGFREFIFN